MKKINEMLDGMRPATPKVLDLVGEIAVMLAMLVDANNGDTLVSHISNDTHVYTLTMTREEK